MQLLLNEKQETEKQKIENENVYAIYEDKSLKNNL